MLLLCYSQSHFCQNIKLSESRTHLSCAVPFIAFKILAFRSSDYSSYASMAVAPTEVSFL